MTAITFTDSQDGTGGTITVSGTGSGATNKLWISRFLGSNTNRSFVLEGTRTGNGTIAVAESVGAYLAVLESTDGSSVDLSEPLCFRVTNGEDPLHWKVTEAIRQFILSAALPGLPTNPELHVAVKLGARLEEVIKGNPSCVYYVPTSEQYEYLDNMTTTVRYPVVMVLNIQSKQSLTQNLKNILAMRQHAGLGFEACALPDVPEVHTVEVEPGGVIDPSKWALNYDVSVMTFTAVSEQYDAI
jgi:hypothetical protein